MDKRNNMKNIALALTVCSLISAGCKSPVPANQISIKAPSGTYDIRTPKNVDIQKLEASVSTNGVFNVKVERWSSTNDPQVIDKSSAGRVAEINAYKDLIGSAVEKGVAGAAKGLKGGL